MPRYRIEFELNAPDDETIGRVVALAEQAAPILWLAGGMRAVRETSRPWVMVEVLETRPAPARRRDA